MTEEVTLAGGLSFTTATGDALEVVEVYTKAVPNNKLKKYLPELRRLAKDESDDISNLKGFASAWRSLGNDKAFRAAQDKVNDSLYYQPSDGTFRKCRTENGLGKSSDVRYGDSAWRRR